MAGDWIKMRVNLVAHPKVLKTAEVLLSDPRFLGWSVLSYSLSGFPPQTVVNHAEERHAALRVTRYVVVASLLRFWGYANEHAKGENIESVTRQDVDDIAGVPGFADALAEVGWATFDDKKGGVVLPAFTEHNVSADERKTSGAERQKRYRERLKQRTPNSDVTRDVTLPEREEKRREDKPQTPPLGFERFWTVYPKKLSKGQAEKAWQKLSPDEQLLERILSAVERAKTRADWRKDAGQFIPHPATWLNAKGWEDETVVSLPLQKPRLAI